MRLIDADALLEIYERNSITDIVVVCDKTVRQHLKAAPTIDAVHVVRCKDCDHADHDIPMSKNFVYCNMWGTISYGNGYCHHSARLTGEEDV